MFIFRAMNIPSGQGIELGLEFSVKGVHVANVDVIGEAPGAGRSSLLGVGLLKKTDADGFTMDVSIVVEAIRNFESEDAGEEGDGFFEVSDVDKRRDLDEVGNPTSAP